MTTTQMAYFLELAECLSYTKAAENLYISQPALSRQIISLETELCAQLFLRSGNSIRLTPAGEAFRSGVKEVYDAYLRLVQRVKRAACGTVTLRIGILEEQMVDASVLNTLAWFYNNHPEVKISVIKDTFSGLMDSLNSQMIDLAVTMTFMLRGANDYSSQILRDNTLFLAVPKTRPISSLDRIALTDFPKYLQNETFLLVSPTDAAPANDEQLMDLAAAGFRPENIMYAPSEGIMALWVACGMGVALMCENHVLVHDPNVKFIPIDGLKKTTSALVWRKENNEPALHLFLNYIRQLKSVSPSDSDPLEP